MDTAKRRRLFCRSESDSRNISAKWMPRTASSSEQTSQSKIFLHETYQHAQPCRECTFSLSLTFNCIQGRPQRDCNWCGCTGPHGERTERDTTPYLALGPVSAKDGMTVYQLVMSTLPEVLRVGSFQVSNILNLAFQVIAFLFYI